MLKLVAAGILEKIRENNYLSKTSQIIFDLHPGFSHMEDEKGNKLHLFKKFGSKALLNRTSRFGPATLKDSRRKDI